MFKSLLLMYALENCIARMVFMNVESKLDFIRECFNIKKKKSRCVEMTLCITSFNRK